MTTEELDEAFDSLMETITKVNENEKAIYMKVYPTEMFVKLSPEDANKLLWTTKYIGYRMKAIGTIYLCLNGEL